MVLFSNINVVEILKLGFPGLVFLLSLMSYFLLSNEQKKEKPRESVLKTIKLFLVLNFFLGISTAVTPIIEHRYFRTPIKNMNLKISSDIIKSGTARICQSETFKNRYVLIKNNSSNKLVQVFTDKVMPCSEENDIIISSEDALKLGFHKGENVVFSVEVAIAEQGFRFEI